MLWGSVMAQTPRVVKVAVAIESAQFNDMMSDEDRRKIESDVATAITVELAKTYPIVDWRTNLGGAIPVATWTAAMVQEPSSSLDPEINVVWRATSGNTVLDMPGLKKILLYREKTAFRPVGAPDQLARDLTKVTVSWVASDANWDNFKKLFLKHVVIANKVIANGSPLVVVPLPYTNVKMAKDSILLVRYRGSGPAGPQQKEITLTNIAPHLSDPVGITETHVNGCETGSASDSLQKKWANCAAPLNANPTQTVSVYAADYKYSPNPDVEDGIIVGNE